MAIGLLARKYRDWIRATLQSLWRKTFWNNTIRSVLLAYLDLCLSAAGQLRLWLKDSDFREAADGAVALALGLVAVGFLAWTILHLKSKTPDELRGEAFVSRYGALTTGITVERYQCRYYVSAFLLRRALFSLIPALVATRQGAEIVLLLFTQTAYMVWYWHNRPHTCRSRRSLEYFNESQVMLCIYHAAVFTYWCKHNLWQYYAGYSFIYAMLFLAFINLQQVVRANVSRARALQRRKQWHKAYEAMMERQEQQRAVEKKQVAARRAAKRQRKAAVLASIAEDVPGAEHQHYCRPVVALAAFAKKYSAA